MSLSTYDWVVINTSAGKDSQTMLRQVVLKAINEDYPLDRVIPVHCDLGPQVEWDGTRELAEEQCRHYGLDLVVVSRPQGDLLDEVKQRAVTIWTKALTAAGVEPSNDFEGLKAQAGAVLGTAGLPSPWPGSDARWCTSDHKRGQVAKVFTSLADRWWQKGSARPCRILNCLGMRGQESSTRAKLKPFKRDERQTNGRRVVDTYLPLFNWSADEVWADIRASGVPFHRAYSLGMPRLSCAFCVMAPRAALLLAGRHNRARLDEYVAVEQAVGSRFTFELSLMEVREALDRGEEPGPVPSWEL